MKNLAGGETGGDNAKAVSATSSVPSQATQSSATTKPSSAAADSGGQSGAAAGSISAGTAANTTNASAAGSGGIASAAADSGGAVVSMAAGTTGAAGAAAGAMAPSAGPLTLELVGGEDLGDGFFAFPESARPPMNQSPPFRWSGGPAAVKSYALVFRDVTNAMPPVKWVLWNIPPDRKQVPANVSGSSAMPSEVPGAAQLGSLGNQGYAGPCCVGNKYEWVAYALDVAELPGTQGQSTAQLNMDVIPMHTLEKSKPLMLRIK